MILAPCNFTLNHQQQQYQMTSIYGGTSSLSSFSIHPFSPKSLSSKPSFSIHCSAGGILAEQTIAKESTAEPLLLNAVRGLDVDQPPVWLMRQAGRYMKTIKLQNPIRQHLLVRNGCGFHSNELPFLPGRVFMEEAIGAEYGEGFETFRNDGPLKVDVDYLNDRLQEGFLQRIRYAMKPDEAFGLIFSWDNVVADMRALKLDSWKQLASEEGKEIPEDAETQRLMVYSSPDLVLSKILRWENSEHDADVLKQRISHLFYENLLKLDKPLEGLVEWLEAVSTARIPCAVVSNLDRKNMVESLERMGIKKYFQAIVSEEDGMEAIAHRFLSAAVKLDRKPSKCVVFEDDPRGVTAAHNCTMMAVALIGSHPAYDLVQADLAVGSFSELSVINLRRLFAHKGSSFMDLQKQVTEKTPPKRRLTTDTIF